MSKKQSMVRFMGLKREDSCRYWTLGHDVKH